MHRHARFRQKLQAPVLMHAMSAHNPLSAKLAAEAGFDAIWGSGFELSASHAVPDANILSAGLHLEMMRAIAAVVDVPVIADIDTGFGNAINVAYVVPQYEAAGVSAVVMEDKTFPKDTSLRADGRQELVRVAEFQGKIEAACAVRRDPDFCVIARTEALIAGLGQAEALARAAAYEAAGADAILIHSKQTTPDEVLAFIAAWSGRVPLVLVPTAYPQLREADIQALGKVGLVIYGNHAIRAAVGAMREVFARIRNDGGIHGVDAGLPTVRDIIDLQGDADMRELERRFLR
ncbi:phosphonopyruvate hydrolase [Achromobacter xylosoxidans]|uniref:phosphonopyruvate hydrolase n=1 Tax=Alcaligenes xylosoxydans xylosoxydans TaxID=85698 RepID=UPI00047E49AD|nr:phosphonopyruvate hydrolase [Achromobacter xylosoxidans]KOQ24056.1 phosphoenolpyruvate phosphomutase [Achromobacter xylosoxidans]KOQ28708.1 phosphoenolpyruvate phosphomutase [Achromobacter xylosoxidans]KOQ32073.1 phosphoenolpyruvate phosphomutase [Achromobacter xylosoxidans]KOQ44743.1 phosphoenolpyruvate phosphomutase [Achromobacter xylosoxidans]KOQ48794.1 phosphoenolpyruvate phosphomutase [Achromobacter xylosoxidans]